MLINYNHFEVMSTMKNELILTIVNLKEGLEVKIKDQNKHFHLDKKFKLYLYDAAMLTEQDTSFELIAIDIETEIIVGRHMVKLKVVQTSAEQEKEKTDNLNNLLLTKVDINNKSKPSTLKAMVEFKYFHDSYPTLTYEMGPDTEVLKVHCLNT